MADIPDGLGRSVAMLVAPSAWAAGAAAGSDAAGVTAAAAETGSCEINVAGKTGSMAAGTDDCLRRQMRRMRLLVAALQRERPVNAAHANTVRSMRVHQGAQPKETQHVRACRRGLD